jgi:hypothetical protein
VCVLFWCVYPYMHGHYGVHAYVHISNACRYVSMYACYMYVWNIKKDDMYADYGRTVMCQMLPSNAIRQNMMR